jgi:GntR family transcriptional regulator/MocR family aminotransferase
VLAPDRRAQLVAWARDRDALIVEDDYDAEYRYDRDPVGAVQGLAPDRVLYAGSASKTLAPALRLGWLVAPPWLAADLAAEKDRADRGTPVLDQVALADLLRRGEIDRHLRRTRRRYRARRDALVGALHDHLPGVRAGGAAAGLHVVAWLPGGADEAAIAQAALDRGVAVDRLHHDMTTVAPRPPALLLGYASLPEAALQRAVALLADACRGSRGAGATAAAPSASASR